MTGNLEMIGRLAIKGTHGQLAALGGDRIVVVGGNAMTVVDLANHGSPTIVGSREFRNHLTGVVVVDGIAFVGENERAIHAIDCRTSALVSLGFTPLLGRPLGRILALGDRLVTHVCGQGAVVVLTQAAEPTIVQWRGTADRVYSLVSDGGRVFAATDRGLALFPWTDRRLAEPTFYFAGDESIGTFQALWLAGGNLVASGYSESDDDFWVMSATEPVSIESSLEFRGKPKVVLSRAGRTLVFHTHYRCSEVADGQQHELFAQYIADDDQRYVELSKGSSEPESRVTCMESIEDIAWVAGNLVALHGDMLAIYALTPGSVLIDNSDR